MFQPHFIRVPFLTTVIVHAGVPPTSSPEGASPAELMNMRSVGNDSRAVATLVGAPWASVYSGPEVGAVAVSRCPTPTLRKPCDRGDVEHSLWLQWLGL